ncbi:hypothetical protein FA95DRAFT_170171 [Auriscalpium vulgare]|uniref:Uncharacterized protein n=1 Tax=Auriscalpium vulgare TaxID=40419 RepID=A0ACB8RN04_9AGAM|nr:hypothetical protein FA95DRAFT_170171 [Auriscalpium vulgare]
MSLYFFSPLVSLPWNQFNPPQPSEEPSGLFVHLSNPIFDAEVHKLMDDLNPSELLDFQPCTRDSVRAEIERQYSAFTEGSEGFRFIQKIDQIIAPLDFFFRAVDKRVSSQVRIAQTVWGAIRFVTQVAQQVSAYFHVIGGTLAVITELVPRYQQYATKMYTEETRVMEALAYVYGDILNVCITTRRLYNRRRGFFRSLIFVLRDLNPWEHAVKDMVRSLTSRQGILRQRIDDEDRRRREADWQRAHERHQQEERRRQQAALDRIST